MRKMITTDWVHVFAGILILVNLALGVWVSEYCYLFTAFIGANFVQFGLTGFCPMA